MTAGTLEASWAKVRSAEHSSDFSAWQDLAKAAEAKGLDSVREAFGALLVEYPLCYGYWRKWANKEVEAGNVHAALQIMQDSVTRAPFVHELWTQYCTVAINSQLYDDDSLRR
jgi:pre-mRNA-processing factor 39